MIIVARGRMWHIQTPTGETVGFASTLVLAKAMADQYRRTKIWTDPPT